MVAVDSSSLIRFLAGESGSDVERVDRVLADHLACLPPVVVAEVLSDPGLKTSVRETLLQLPLLEVLPDYWERVGTLRARLIRAGRRARLADALVAQSCLDHDVPLITYDKDFKLFERLAGLRLVA